MIDDTLAKATKASPCLPLYPLPRGLTDSPTQTNDSPNICIMKIIEKYHKYGIVNNTN